MWRAGWGSQRVLSSDSVMVTHSLPPQPSAGHQGQREECGGRNEGALHRALWENLHPLHSPVRRGLCRLWRYTLSQAPHVRPGKSPPTQNCCAKSAMNKTSRCKVKTGSVLPAFLLASVPAWPWASLYPRGSPSHSRGSSWLGAGWCWGTWEGLSPLGQRRPAEGGQWSWEDSTAQDPSLLDVVRGPPALQANRTLVT